MKPTRAQKTTNKPLQERARRRIIRMMQNHLCVEAETWGGGLRFFAKRNPSGRVTLTEYRLVSTKIIADPSLP